MFIQPSSAVAITTTVLISFASVCHADAVDAPTRGVVYGIGQNSSLTYECSKPRNNEITCDFLQMSVMKKGGPKDLDKAVQAAKDEFKSEKPKDYEKMCKDMAQLNRIISGKEPEPKESKFGSMNALEKRDLMTFVEAMNRYCANRTEENLVELAKISSDKDARTCRVTSNKFSQTFFHRDAEEGKPGAWIVRSSAEGDCGIVQLSRFEAEESTLGLGALWKYVSRKAITNPKGTTFMGISCSDLDQNEYVYDWRSQEIALGCDYLNLGP